MNNIYLFLFTVSIVLVNLGFQVEIVEGIVGGRLANDGEFKAIVSIWTNGRYICTGSMIGKKYVLTAAHCVIDSNNRFKDSEFSIRAGVIDYNNPSAITAVVDAIYVPRLYERKAIDPLFGYNNEIDDIAILRLNRNLSRRTEIKILKLPKHVNERFSVYHQITADIIGFGANESTIHIGRDSENIENCGELCGKLKVANTVLVIRSDCIYEYGLTLFRHICAKVESADDNPSGACYGDAGSPLIFDGDIIIGVLAQHTPNCNERYRASLYTRVPIFIDFVLQVFNDEDNQLGDEVFDNVRVADWLYRSNRWSMIERT